MYALLLSVYTKPWVRFRKEEQSLFVMMVAKDPLIVSMPIVHRPGEVSVAGLAYNKSSFSIIVLIS